MILRVTKTEFTDEQRAEESMVSVCCAGLEGAISAGIVRGGSLGILYVAVNGGHWPIAFCPFCGQQRSEVLLIDDKDLPRPSRRRCNRCGKKGHDTRNCTKGSL